MVWNLVGVKLAPAQLVLGLYPRAKTAGAWHWPPTAL